MMTFENRDRVMKCFSHASQQTIGELHDCGISNREIFDACEAGYLLVLEKVYVENRLCYFPYSSKNPANSTEYIKDKKFEETITLTPSPDGKNILYQLKKEQLTYEIQKETLDISKSATNYAQKSLFWVKIGVLVSLALGGVGILLH